ncbi:MAG: TRAP transporter small permease [Acetobacteraceae bacterium]|nr:TRAP transporter small permease [Acetobacteraceae bacterium]
MITRLAARVLALAEWLLAAALLAMLVMVFGNVVLRYGFDSGILVAEELSRVLFVWVTFLGAVAVMQRRGHLGFDLVVRALPLRARLVCRVVSGLLMLACCLVFLHGAWTQTAMNMANAAPVSGLPLGYAYAAAVVGAAGLALLVAADILAALQGKEAPPQHHEAEPGA